MFDTSASAEPVHPSATVVLVRDGREGLEVLLVQRNTAESADEAHELRLMPPTFVSLNDIADCSDCAEARQRLDTRAPFIYAPRMVFVEDGVCFLYAGDAGYDSEALDASGPRHRLYMVNDQLRYLREL